MPRTTRRVAAVLALSAAFLAVAAAPAAADRYCVVVGETRIVCLP